MDMKLLRPLRVKKLLIGVQIIVKEYSFAFSFFIAIMYGIFIDNYEWCRSNFGNLLFD